MSIQENTNSYNMPMTLEKHFENLARLYPAVQEIHSLWILLKKRIEDELIHSRSVFVNYSLHDGSHSRSIIQAVERFLGEERISRLSATDTFMLLACTYAHDYGMAQTFNKIYDILGSSEFEDFLREKEKHQHLLEKEDAWAVNNLLHYLNESKPHIPLNDIYFSIMLVIQLYLRPTHWKGVTDIRSDFEGLFLGHIKKRFIYGSEGIVEICMCHGQAMDALFNLSFRADGMIGDEYHPRFVAAMLRLGDLLDLDNGRFPMWFVSEIAQNRNIIPRLSVLHFRKHEAVSHLLITPKRIEIIAQCHSRKIERVDGGNKQKEDVEIEKAQKECYEVAALVSEWTEWLSKECHEMVLHWNEITQPDFGRPPANLNIKIFVDGKEYMAENRTLQMQMSQERVMKLLEGTSIYRDKYVGIREMVQNAMDASLLQLWNDIIQNRYISYGLSKNNVMEGFDLFDLLDKKKASIFENYDITVEVIEDKLREQVFIVVKDKGIGITEEDMRYISDIGSSKEKNMRVRKLMEKMPAWLKPSGVFGIGLQSVFQMTDCVEFYTRQHNAPERLISLFSYGKNRGKIESREVPENADGLYYDNAIPGTNVKIAVEPGKLLNKNGEGKTSHLVYYDPEFDAGEELDMIFAEVSRACENKIKESKYDYFNVFYEPIKIEKDGTKVETAPRKCLRKSYIYPRAYERRRFGESIQYFPYTSDGAYSFIDNMAYFWDKKTFRCYCLTVRPCRITVEDGKKRLYLPEKVPNLYNISYKFNMISNAESVYAHRNRSGRLHAGFLKLDVLIMDDKPMNYMNIDRDRLRDGAIDEDELLAVRAEILKRWCEHFCRLDAEQYRRQGKMEIQKQRFRSMPEIFFSLVLLFYQNVPQDLFKQFIVPYIAWIRSMDPMLEQEEIHVEELWNQENLFQTGIVLPGVWAKVQCELKTDPAIETRQENIIDVQHELKTDSAIEIQKENIIHLPHRMVNIKAIRQDGDRLWYYLHLQAAGDEVRSIRMNEGACLHDYINALDPFEDKLSRVDFYSLLKKVFKPDGRFESLLVPCFPHTFRKGRNMESDLDYCIGWYILSPFDSDSVGILKSGLEEERDVLNKLKDKVMTSRQIDKCVSYIMKKRYAGCSDEEETKRIIKKQYEEFLESFYKVLMKHRKIVLNQFNEKKESDSGKTGC